VNPNREEALRWYLKAAERGNAAARQAVRELTA
jgi:TPR repeat protein